MLYYTYMNSPKNEVTLKEIAETIKKAREKAKLTQAEVAEKVGMDVTYYARIERGEIDTSGSNLIKLFKLLKIKI